MSYAVDDITYLLPNTLIRWGRSRVARPMTQLVVVGRVVDVVEGPAWTATEQDDSVEVAFDDPKAMWKEVHATIGVDEVIAATVPADQVVVRFIIDGDQPFQPARAQLLDTGPMLLPLRRDIGPDGSTAWTANMHQADLLADVDARGRMHMPCVGKRIGRQLLRNAATLDELRAAAAQPERIVRLEGGPLG